MTPHFENPTVEEIRKLRPPRPWLSTSEEKRPANQTMGPLEVLLVLIWFGIATGLVEVAILFLRKQFTNAAMLGLLQMNRHATWMIPISEMVSFGVLGLVLFAAALIRRRLATRLVLAFCSFLAAFALLATYQGLANVAWLALSGGIAAGATRLATPHWQRLRRGVFMSLPCLGITLVGLISFETARELGNEQAAFAKLPPARAGAPNVIFIVLDTVRAQNLSLYGYHRNTSPHLAKLAQAGIRFDRARTTASWTLPSHASMFTGQWPHQLSTRLEHPLDGTYPTLAEYLRNNGYATAGFVANTFFCNAWYGLGRGFIHYEDIAVNPVEALRSTELGRGLVKLVAPASRDRPSARFARKDAATINRETLAWLDQHPKKQPFFLFLNYYDAHDPYLTTVEPAHPFGLRPRTSAERALLRDWHRSDPQKRTARDVTLAQDGYDDCIAELDGHLNRLLTALDKRGLLKNTVVLVTSDHGEEFREHGGFGHGQSLHGEVIRVPLIVSAPGLIPSGRVVRESVTLRDLPATIVDLAGLKQGSPFPGQSLARCWSEPSGDAIQTDGLILTEILEHDLKPREGWKPPRSLVLDENLYIRNNEGREEIYNLETDPGESKNLAGAAESQALLARFRALLEPIDRLDPSLNGAHP